MSSTLQQQANYWDRQSGAFDAIYTHRKSALANLLDRVFRHDMYGRYRFAIEQSQPIEERTVLDVGCGSGRYSVAFAKAGARHVCGIDISQQMLERARSLATHEGVQERCEFQHSDVLGFAASTSFDIVIAMGLLDYIRDPLPVLRKLQALTRDRAVISFPRRYTWRAAVRKVRLGVQGCPVYFYTRQSVDQLLNQAGFLRYTLESIGQLYCVAAFVEPRSTGI